MATCISSGRRQTLEEQRVSVVADRYFSSSLGNQGSISPGLLFLLPLTFAVLNFCRVKAEILTEGVGYCLILRRTGKDGRGKSGYGRQKKKPQTDKGSLSNAALKRCCSIISDVQVDIGEDHQGRLVRKSSPGTQQYLWKLLQPNYAFDQFL